MTEKAIKGPMVCVGISLMLVLAGGCSQGAWRGAVDAGGQCGVLFPICAPVGAIIGHQIYGEGPDKTRAAPPKAAHPEAVLGVRFMQMGEWVTIEHLAGDAHTTLRRGDRLIRCGEGPQHKIPTVTDIEKCKAASGYYEFIVLRWGEEFPAFLGKSGKSPD